ncbi:MAG: hypothetical protein U1A27_08095 [Phycisphaerae bacterium]
MRRLFSALAAGALLSAASSSFAALPGSIEDFSTGLGGFFSQSIRWVSSGGVGGAGDGYAEPFRDLFAGNLGATSADPLFTGSLIADGVTGYEFWLNDTGADDPLSIHMAIGVAQVNVWMNINGISPPLHQWQQYTIDFSNPSDWVQIQGSDSFADALALTDRLLIRHDLAPYSQVPDSIIGDFGLDRVRVLPEPATALLALCGAALVRRRAARR